MGVSFIPHGLCLLWSPFLITLHTASDLCIAIAYFLIPAGLIYFTKSRRYLPFGSLLYWFSAFIILCGCTHLANIMEIWTTWYLASGILKALTAAVSLVTAAKVFVAIPALLSLPGLHELRDVAARLEHEQLAMSTQFNKDMTRLITALRNIAPRG